jgi:hypothetical protein
MPKKIDFEKAYDKVKWPFLQQALRMKDFHPKWCEWIKTSWRKEVWVLKLIMI